jgi:hypothetical protein
MRLFPGRKIGLRTAVAAIVVGGIVLSAACVHFLWWRTATSVSRALVGTLEAQITQALRRQWWAVVGEVERLSQGMRDLLAETTDGLPPDRIMLAAGRHSMTVSWLLLVPPEGDVVALQSLGDTSLRLLRAGPDGTTRELGMFPRPHAAEPRSRRRRRACSGFAPSLGSRPPSRRRIHFGSTSRVHRTVPAERSLSRVGPAPAFWSR